LFIARAGLDKPDSLVDPDGNRVTLVPPGHDGISGIAVHVTARDPAAFARFYGEALGLVPDDGGYRCGDSLISVNADSTAPRTEALRARGYRYVTIQVRDVNAEHAGIVARGGEEGRPPVTLGKTARVSFVRDPDGNWIEISQRASLTGPLESTD
jgi:lactoylglutathione lyase